MPILVERLADGARRHRLGGGLRRRRFARRHRQRRPRDRPPRPAGAGDPPARPARPVDRLRRRRAVVGGALFRGHGRRPAARRHDARRRCSRPSRRRTSISSSAAATSAAATAVASPTHGANASAAPARAWRRRCFKAELTDPMSGFFVMSRAAFDAEVRALSQRGFKILLDIFASAPRPLRYRELPCRFNARGSSARASSTRWWRGSSACSSSTSWSAATCRCISSSSPWSAITGIAVHLAVLEAFAPGGLDLRHGPDRRRHRGDDVELRPQQRHHLSRPAPARRRLPARPAVVLCHRRGRRGRQYRRHRRPVQRRAAAGGWRGSPAALVGVVWNYTMSSLFTWHRRTLT